MEAAAACGSCCSLPRSFIIEIDEKTHLLVPWETSRSSEGGQLLGRPEITSLLKVRNRSLRLMTKLIGWLFGRRRDPWRAHRLGPSGTRDHLNSNCDECTALGHRILGVYHEAHWSASREAGDQFLIEVNEEDHWSHLDVLTSGTRSLSLVSSMLSESKGLVVL